MSASVSPKRRHREKASKPTPVCKVTDKLAYPSRKRGLTALNYLRSAPVRVGRTVPVAIYRCRHCGNWHLTSKEQRA